MIQEHNARLGTKALCEALGEPRASWYRAQKPSPPKTQRSPSPRKLTPIEEEEILSVLNSERFRDKAPGEIYATLLDEETYLCSERTMYRLLARHGQSVIRMQRPPREYQRPELLASRPNELWSWDITKLKGPAKWTYYYLYKIMDVYSRFVVGWMVAYRETAQLAEELFSETILKHEILPGTLTIHADNGSPMTAATVGQLLLDLGVSKTHSRPHVSNDNPYSEAAFKTLKYRPEFPGLFGCIEDARAFCREFFYWYNFEHRHSGIAMVTPATVHFGRSEEVIAQRSNVLVNAYLDHPERFVRGMPKVKNVPSKVWINKPDSNLETEKVLA